MVCCRVTVLDLVSDVLHDYQLCLPVPSIFPDNLIFPRFLVFLYTSMRFETAYWYILCHQLKLYT